MKLDNVGTIGLINDVDPQDLPDGAFSGGQNIRFKDGYLEKVKGYSSVFGTPSVAPYWMLPIVSSSTLYWVYCGLAKVYVTDGTTHTNITRQTASVDVDYSATAAKNWSGGFLSGIGVFNNGVDDPQVWSPAVPGTKLTSLKWDASETWSSKNHQAKIIRPFGNFWVALDITKSSTNYPYLVKWAHPASVGAEPVTWDETDTTKDAGEFDLGKTGGALVDALTLRDSFIIYKEDSIYSMRHTGGEFVFEFKEIFQFGAISSRCIKEFEGKHIVLSHGDLIVHDGQSAKSIINKRMKNWLFNSIDQDNFATCFVTQNHQKNEFMVCFPETGHSLPSKALIWNYRDNTFGTRDLPNTPHIAYGIVDSGSSVDWDSDSESWDDDSSSWNQRSFNPTVLRSLMASGTNLYLLDDTNTEDGTIFTAYAERASWDFGTNTIKFVKKLWPRIIASGEVTIKLGTQFNKNDGISWTSYTFDPSTDEYIDTLIKGRFISFRIESSANVEWKMAEIDFEVIETGHY